jgi:hypothetical protein
MVPPDCRRSLFARVGGTSGSLTFSTLPSLARIIAEARRGTNEFSDRPSRGDGVSHGTWIRGLRPRFDAVASRHLATPRRARSPSRPPRSSRVVPWRRWVGILRVTSDCEADRPEPASGPRNMLNRTREHAWQDSRQAVRQVPLGRQRAASAMSSAASS